MKLLIFLLFLIGSSSTHKVSLHAQEKQEQRQEQEDEIEIIASENEEASSGETFINYWNQHFKLDFITSGSYYANGYRAYNTIAFSYKETFSELFYTHLSSHLIRRDIFVELEDYFNLLRIEVKNDKFEEHTFDFLLRDFHLGVNLGEYAALEVGRKAIVWGQFEIFSVVDTLLPFRLSSQGFSLKKIDNREPQDVALLKIYPGSKFEVELYYLPWINLDPQYENYLNHFSTEAEQKQFIDTDGELATLSGDVGIDIPPRFKDIQNTYQFAARALTYQNDFTLGFTFFHGYEHLVPSKEKTLVFNRDLLVNFPGRISDLPYEVNETITLKKQTSWAIELAIPWKEYSFKFEFSHSIKTGIEVNFRDPEVLNWILTQNGGSLILRKNQFFYGFALDADYERWYFNLFLFGIRDVYLGKYKDAIDLANEEEEPEEVDDERIIDDGQDDGGFEIGQTEFLDENIDIPILPSLNIGWYITKDKNNLLGLGAGTLIAGASVGASLYFIQELFDDTLKWSFAFHALLFLNDRHISQETDVKGELNLGGSLYVIYSL